MKNNTFDISRFVLVFKKDLQENWRKNLISILALFGLMLIIYMRKAKSDYSINMNNIPYGMTLDNYLEHISSLSLSITTLLFIVTFLVYVSSMMKPMSTKRKRIQYLMMPASSLEKFLTRFIQYTIGFIVVFFISFYLVDLIRVVIYTPLYPNIEVRSINFSLMFGDNSNQRYLFSSFKQFLIWTSYFTLTVSLFVLGTTFWQKNVFVKNFVATAALVIVYMGISTSLMNILSNKSELQWNSFLSLNQFFDSNNIILIMTVTLAFSTFNCVLAYFRFKESEFIQRW